MTVDERQGLVTATNAVGFPVGHARPNSPGGGCAAGPRGASCATRRRSRPAAGASCSSTPWTATSSSSSSRTTPKVPRPGPGAEPPPRSAPVVQVPVLAAAPAAGVAGWRRLGHGPADRRRDRRLGHGGRGIGRGRHRGARGLRRGGRRAVGLRGRGRVGRRRDLVGAARSPRRRWSRSRSRRPGALGVDGHDLSRARHRPAGSCR